MTHHDIVKKLIGKINPIGSTDVDKERFKNLEDTCTLIHHLIMDVDEVYYANKNRYEFSINKAIDYAKDFLETKVSLIEQPLSQPTDLEDSYWKQRCRAAEYIISPFAFRDLPKEYNEWKTLKDSHEIKIQ